MKLICKNYELTSTNIIIEVSDGKNDCSYSIDRAEFENWLTDGTGVVDMSFAHHDGNVLRETEIKEPIADYWEQGKEINNSPVLEHIKLYITRDELSRSLVRAELLQQYLKDLLQSLEPIESTAAQVALSEYGIIKKEIGELSASAMFKRIITSRNAA